MTDWQHNLVAERARALDLLRHARRIAIIGIKPESKADQPAHYVPAYLQRAGYEIIPVPCYFPEVPNILGEPVYRTLTDVPGDLDLVVIFRRPADVPRHLDELLAKRPAAVWMQSGIRHDAVAEQLARAGIQVVQDRCTMVEHRSLSR
jgi:predicted CoA-binding protein